MSKLADAIRRSQRIEAAPMGFGAARQAPKATMLVGYRTKDPAAAGKAVQAGADVVVVHTGGKDVSVATVAGLHEATGQTPLGIWGSIAPEATEELRKAGLDFVLFNPDETAAATLLDEELGYVLELPKDPEELLLRSLEPLGLDALYLHDLPSPLTVSRQIELARVSTLAHKPIIATVKAHASKEELQCLRAAGAALLLVEDDIEGIAQLKATVLSLPTRKQRREDRSVVSLPRGAAPAAPEGGDDDDDEDE